jgi:hypothetical protein
MNPMKNYDLEFNQYVTSKVAAKRKLLRSLPDNDATYRGLLMDLGQALGFTNALRLLQYNGLITPQLADLFSAYSLSVEELKEAIEQMEFKDEPDE